MGSLKPFFFLTEWTTYFLITKAVLFTTSTVRLDGVSFLYSVKCTAVTDLQPFQPIKKIMVAHLPCCTVVFILCSAFFKPYAKQISLFGLHVYIYHL